MKNLFKILFFPFLGIIRSKPKAATAVPSATHPDRVHIFHGNFASELAATQYCLDPASKNEPTPLMRDLPDAVIDPSEVEIIFGAERIGGAATMLASDPSDLLAKIGADNTLIMIAEAAFCGLPYTLNDTPHLRHAGAFNVM